MTAPAGSSTSMTVATGIGVNTATPSTEGGNGGSSDTNLWISLGGLALGVGGFFFVKGLHYLYRQQQMEEKEWVQRWSKSSELSSSEDKKLKRNRMKCIYLDYNGTTPVYKDVLKAMLPYLEDHFGNPSSNHAYGTRPREAIQNARKQILFSLLQQGVLNIQEEDVVSDDEDGKAVGETKHQHTTIDLTSEDRLDSIWFTGCGTESDNLAIQLAVQSSSYCDDGNQQTKMHIVASNVEHPAIEKYLKYLEQVQGSTVEVTYVPVQTDGRVLVKDVLDAIKGNTIFVTIMYANNESGALQPVKEISVECRKRGILFHTDAAQAVGKVSCALVDLGYPDMITIVGHKLGAPKGIAALYVRPGCLEENGRQITSFSSSRGGIMLMGGGQEFGYRSGTENTPYIVGLGYACEKAQMNLIRNQYHMETLRSRLLQNLQDQLGGQENVQPNGPTDPTLRLCNTLSVEIKNIHSGQLLATIGHLVAASAGAACHANSTDGVSAVLLAMKVPLEFARGTLRLSVGPKTTIHEIDRAAWIIAETVKLQWSGELVPT